MKNFENFDDIKTDMKTAEKYGADSERFKNGEKDFSGVNLERLKSGEKDFNSEKDFSVGAVSEFSKEYGADFSGANLERLKNGEKDFNSAKKVIVGMSGGVDSSVAAALLKECGFDAAGLFMRNWREEDEGGHCTADEDFFDVKRVAISLGIPYYSADFSREYMDGVFLSFVEEYKKGRTPNPDVLCNREIKFGAFSLAAKKLGADFIATGHYADTEKKDGLTFLKKSADTQKDQTYFLNQLTEKQLENVIFPLGRMQKTQVRAAAKKYGLATAAKKDSTGICFIGERRFREFLAGYIPMKEGDIMTADGKIVGRHNGVFFYTIGQRRGLGIGGESGFCGGRWFVVGKDVEKNILFVSNGDESPLFKKEIEVENFNFITVKPPKSVMRVTARIRHRQPEQNAAAEFDFGTGRARIVFDEAQRAAAAGQYAVLYDGEYVIGGGVIC
ncbi:MAG: tRNA 2-thiouridine(34) synthase MnmA [Clostridiales bacterium]|nr:tRNA 2-thiouridine(34) synthase MnmA [Clostridiales bacterium]